MGDIARQRDAINFLKERDRAMLSLCPGYGKCRVSLLALPEDVGHLIIVCPTVVLLHWPAEIRRWRPELGKVQVIKSSKQKLDFAARVTVVAYGVMTNRMKDGAEGLPRPDAVIIDEFHALKTPYSNRRGKKKGQRTRAGYKLFKDARIGYLLSGTPILNRPSELGTALQALGVIRVLKNFQAVYCGGWQAPWGWEKDGAGRDIPGLKGLLEPVMFRRPASDLKMITAGRLDPRVLELDQPVHRQEKKFDREAIAKNPNPIAFEGLSELMKLSGLKKAKMSADHVAQVLEAEDSVVVFCWHTELALELETRLSRFGVVSITGATPDTAAAAEEFQNGPARVCVANMVAGGVGVNLFKASYVIFAEAPWNPSILDQCISRCDRVGQTKVVRVDILTVHKSIDAFVLHHILNKDEIIESVITTTGVVAMSKTFTGLDVSLLRAVEFRAEELGLDMDEWVVGAQAKQSGGEEAPEKPKATGKRTTKKAAAKKPDPEPEEPEFEFDLADVRTALRGYMEAEGGDAARALLKKFNAHKLTDVAPEQYVEFMDAMTS